MVKKCEFGPMPGVPKKRQAGALQLVDEGGRFRAEPDRLADADDLVGEIGLHHAQESAQALIVDVDGGHAGHLTRECRMG